MKKGVRFFIALICACLYGLPLPAQSIDKAAASYRQFNKLRAEGADEATIYTALYQCYKDYAAALAASAPAAPAYNQAKNALRELYPFLQSGAAYHSGHGSPRNALMFAQAFMDIPLMEAFRAESFVRDDYFPTMAYFAASGTFNAGDYEKAIDYFRVYLSTGDQKNRQPVYTFMAKAYMNIENYELAMSVLNEATDRYPSDFNMLSIAINSCIEREDNANLQKFLTKAMTLKPGDETLLNIQGKLYEDTGDFQKALNIYNRMRQTKPNSLSIARHVALNYYNLGVMHYNKASMEQNESAAGKYSRQAKEYFSAAASVLQDIVANDPASVKYKQALATAYSCMGDRNRLETVNTQLAALGCAVIAANSTPALIAYSERAPAPKGNARATPPAPSAMGPEGSDAPARPGSPDQVPLYSRFAKEYVESRIRKWQNKDPYETVEEYRARVTEETRKVRIKELLKQAEADYIETYTRQIRFKDMLLKPYDAENRVFLVESSYGELIVPVPRENNEAKVFESSWSGMQFKNPKFYINNDKLTLSGLTFVTPAGNTYCYNGNESLNYTETFVDVSFDPIDNDLFAGRASAGSASRVGRQEIKTGKVSSDVDKNIPETKGVNGNTFAVIISNENYDMVTRVPMALNDGETFGRYCEKTLGLPKDNIRLYRDASYGVMIRAVRDIKEIAAAYSGDLRIIFYYAGHGIPNEATKDAFLLPVDADGTQAEGCYSLNRLYSELGALNARSVVVFLDACFSGAERDGGMLASARGVALKAKKETPRGNMVVFSAASGDETAFPYKEKGHGLFTYFLLKKLQESKGNVSLKELGEYIVQQVKKQSVVVNRKTQTPSVTPSASLSEEWAKLKLTP